MYELCDFPARIFQHEMDHLNGVLYIDKVIHGVRMNSYEKNEYI